MAERLQNILLYLGDNKSVIHGAKLSSPAVTDVETETDPAVRQEKAKQYAIDEGINIVGGALSGIGLAASLAKTAKTTNALRDVELAKDAARETASKTYDIWNKANRAYKALLNKVKSLTLSGASLQQIIEALKALNVQGVAVLEAFTNMNKAHIAYDGYEYVAKPMQRVTTGGGVFNPSYITTLWSNAAEIIPGSEYFGWLGRLNKAYDAAHDGWKIADNIETAATVVPLATGVATVSNKQGGLLSYLDYIQ